MSSDNRENDADEGQNIAEEYEIWKKNCPAMYQFVAESVLTWPSLTVQWIPQAQTEDTTDTKDHITQSLVFGTYSAGAADEEYVEIGNVNLPRLDSSSRSSKSAVGIDSRVHISSKMKHSGEPNRARYQWQDPSIIATSSVSGTVYIYDTKQGSVVKELKHHSDNGYGIAWNPITKGALLSGSDDCTVAVWDVEAPSSEVTIQPVKVLRDHAGIVNDVAWHKDGTLFGSVSEDKSMIIYDHRSYEQVHKTSGQKDADNTLAFNPFSQYLVATGSEDETVGLWDLRNMSHKLHTFVGHSDKVTSLEWSPHDDGIIASAGADRRVILWDLRRIGEEQMPDDAEDAVPELMFMHGGHTSAVADISWNREIPWMLASVAEDNICQIWVPNRAITSAAKEQGDDIKEGELE